MPRTKKEKGDKVLPSPCLSDNAQFPHTTPYNKPPEWTPSDDEALLQLRSLGTPWKTISEKLDRHLENCRSRYAALRKKNTLETWSSEVEEVFKKAYEKKKADVWKSIAAEMGFNGTWQVLETKAFELGKKGMK